MLHVIKNTLLPWCTSLALALVLALVPGLSLANDGFGLEPSAPGNTSQSSNKSPKLSVPEETAYHQRIARQYQSQRRYELARQHLLLALAASNTTELRDQLQRELQVVDLQLRTLR